MEESLRVVTECQTVPEEPRRKMQSLERWRKVSRALVPIKAVMWSVDGVFIVQ